MRIKNIKQVYIYIYICFRFLVVETILPIPHNPSFLPMLLSMVYLVPNYLIIYLFYVVFQTVFPVTSYQLVNYKPLNLFQLPLFFYGPRHNAPRSSLVRYNIAVRRRFARHITVRALSHIPSSLCVPVVLPDVFDGEGGMMIVSADAAEALSDTFEVLPRSREPPSAWLKRLVGYCVRLVFHHHGIFFKKKKKYILLT